MSGGRPSVYKSENAEIARLACIAGATNATLAERFGVSRTTIDNWIAAIPDFSDAVRGGRAIADDAIVSALFARARGMQRKITKVFCHDGKPITADYTEEVLPDVRACIFWLRNRRPEEWREDRPIVDEAEEAERWRELEEASRRAGLADRDDAARERVDGREAETPALSPAEGALRDAAARLHVLP